MPRLLVKRYRRVPLAVYVGRIENGWCAWNLLFRVPYANRLMRMAMWWRPRHAA